MSKKMMYLTLLLVSVSFIFYWTGCESSIGESPTASMELESKGDLQLSFSKASVTTGDSYGVDTVTAILTRSHYESVLMNLAIGDGSASGIMYDVAEGTWQLTVKAKDSTGTVLYSGVAQVDIVADTTTYVTLALSAASTSGNLSINVTWEQGDGVNWTEYDEPVLDIGAPGEWDGCGVSYCSVIYNGTGYEMWYTGYDGSNARIGYATSVDGVNWEKYFGNPVVDLGDGGDWDASGVVGPSVLFDGVSYKMWYGGYDGSHYQIGYATSSDGVNWTKNAYNPVLTYGEVGSWDSYDVGSLNVIFNEGNYEMWYLGYEGTNRLIGYATSSNGINWTKYSGNPVLETGASTAWDGLIVTCPIVVFNADIYELWYSGYDGTSWGIGYAKSSDGANWTKCTDNPVLKNGVTGEWNSNKILSSAILYNGTSYKMWYMGNDGTNDRIGYATSP